MNALTAALKYNDHYNNQTFTAIESVLWDEVDNDTLYVITNKVIDACLQICGDNRYNGSVAHVFALEISAKAKALICKHLIQFMK